LDGRWKLEVSLVLGIWLLVLGVTETAAQEEEVGKIFLGFHEIGLAPWRGFVYLKWFMNDEHKQVTGNKVSLEQRMARRPQVLARFHAIADMMDQAVAQGCTADKAEERAIEHVRQLGGELLGDWAQEQQGGSLARARDQHPQSIKHIKKK
jgi:hypothetical protein